jgi:hypothetical protein
MLHPRAAHRAAVEERNVDRRCRLHSSSTQHAAVQRATLDGASMQQRNDAAMH